MQWISLVQQPAAGAFSLAGIISSLERIVKRIIGIDGQRHERET